MKKPNDGKSFTYNFLIGHQLLVEAVAEENWRKAIEALDSLSVAMSVWSETVKKLCIDLKTNPNAVWKDYYSWKERTETDANSDGQPETTGGVPGQSGDQFSLPFRDE